MFQKFHQTTVSADFTRGYMLLFGTLTFTSQGICNFVNILLMELMGNLIKERAESALKKAASEHETISDFCFMFVVYRAIVEEALLKIKECLPEEEKVPGKTCAQVLQFHLHKPLQQLGVVERPWWTALPM